MATKSLSRDRALVSSQSHEIEYAAKKVGKNGKASVLRAKKALGRTATRKKVMAKARSSRASAK